MTIVIIRRINMPHSFRETPRIAFMSRRPFPSSFSICLITHLVLDFQVHKGHVHESMTLLQPYLPSGGASTSPYSEAGALYALGLIHANKGGAGDSKTITYLSDALR